jgi:hypothetical protein
MPASIAGQDSPCLDDLASRIREAHTGVAAAFVSAIDRAIDAGETLIIAKKSKLIPHGQWGKFLKRCGVGDRQAERYMRLAWLVAANPTCKSDLAELSIEQAIKLLSPLKPPIDAPACGQPPERSKPNRPDFTGTDIIAAWIGSSPSERTRALNAIGLMSLLAAMPEAWWPLIEQRLTARRETPAPTTMAVPIIPDDLTIPDCLRSEPPAALLKVEPAK